MEGDSSFSTETPSQASIYLSHWIQQSTASTAQYELITSQYNCLVTGSNQAGGVDDIAMVTIARVNIQQRVHDLQEGILVFHKYDTIQEFMIHKSTISTISSYSNLSDNIIWISPKTYGAKWNDNIHVATTRWPIADKQIRWFSVKY